MFIGFYFLCLFVLNSNFNNKRGFVTSSAKKYKNKKIDKIIENFGHIC